MSTNTKETDVDVLRKDIEDLKASVSALIGDLKKSADARGTSAAESARAKLDSLGQSASDMARAAADRGRHTAEAAADTVRDRPLQSVLIAFGAGLLLAKLLDRR